MTLFPVLCFLILLISRMPKQLKRSARLMQEAKQKRELNNDANSESKTKVKAVSILQSNPMRYDGRR